MAKTCFCNLLILLFNIRQYLFHFPSVETDVSFTNTLLSNGFLGGFKDIRLQIVLSALKWKLNKRVSVRQSFTVNGVSGIKALTHPAGGLGLRLVDIVGYLTVWSLL